ncbi:MAG: ABC transporter substrate-binding protein [Saprospiraceae bacterium]|nr:ABC transporter substrate-binding protein [Saprospiraceae bacterium]
MYKVTDMMGRSVVVPPFPERIVSLVPSQTELLFDLGLESRIVGVTKYCIHPSRARMSATIIGGTKTIRSDKIRRLKPDLIIGNKEENDQELIRQLESEFPIWLSEIYTLDDAYEMIKILGTITQTQRTAASLITAIQSAFAHFLPKHKGMPIRVAYIIWKKPWMGVGNKTFIHDMLEQAGFCNAFEHLDRYPVLTSEELQQIKPDVVLLSSEPFPFREKHCSLISTLLPKTKVFLANGEYFSWFGSRLLEAPSYYAVLRHTIVEQFVLNNKQ